MAYYALAPLMCALIQNEVYMQVYATQSLSNQVMINRGGNDFGMTTIFDWSIADGLPDGSPNAIGHARGMKFKSSMNMPNGFNINAWYTSMILAFEDSRFNGSTLQVMGFTPKDGQWSIIGGMGEFTMARGIINHHQDTRIWIYEITIHAFYTPMRASNVSGLIGCKH